MITYKCKNCGGEVTIDGGGNLVCPYCDSKANFSDAELREYREFRTAMLHYLVAVAENKEQSTDAEYIWKMAECVQFTDADGTTINVNYIYRCEQDGVSVFAAKTGVIYVFPAGKKHLARKMLDNVAALKYPAADLKNLKALVPMLRGVYDLKDGGEMLVFGKGENVFPLALFGNLPYEHVAWIVSRMENIACLFNYNDVTHNGIETDSLFINPKTHEAVLMGAWWRMTPVNTTADLKALRETAKKLLGRDYESIPKMFKDFLDGKPAADAFSDFEKWDEVIEKGLGGRHFHTLSASKIVK